MQVGRLRQIWQYPLKSASGQTLEQAYISPAGIVGDRCWAVIDGQDMEIRSAKRWPELLNLKVRMPTQPNARASIYGADVPDIVITLPDGSEFSGRDANADELLSEFLGRTAKLSPLRPASDHDHYRLAKARAESDFSTDMGLLEGEQPPDFSATPDELMAQLENNATPPGTYFDAFPLHLLTSSSLDYLSNAGDVQAVLPRFRANFLVDTEEPGMPENAWVGKRLKIGEAILRVNSRTVRCSMPSRAQIPHGIEAEKSMARAMVDHVDRQLGINLLVEQPGACHVDDAITLIEE